MNNKVLANCILIIITLFPYFGKTQVNMTKKDSLLQTVPHVDIEKYSGLWYEISLYPQVFEKGCECTTAEYSFKEKYVEVINTCRKNGKIKKIKGKAFVVPNSGNAKLKVQFFWPFKGDYWIIALDEKYSWAVVSSPDKNYLWILSRTPKMDPTLYQRILDDLIQRGFDQNRIVKTKQDCIN
jgi:apolipoprotein D and lipocalin family protein